MAAAPTVRPVPDRRPPAVTFAAVRPPRPSSDQPPLDLHTPGPDRPPPVFSDGDLRILVVDSEWCAEPRPGLPAVVPWARTVAVVVVEVLHGRRSVLQLGRWVAEDVYTALHIHQRRLRPGATQRVPPQVRLIRIQHPHPEVAEVTVILQAGSRCGALAMRLEAYEGRWLCTALEVGSRTPS